MSPLEFIKLPFTQLLGGALAASLIANVFLFTGYTHQTVKKVECTQAVKTVTKEATEKKIIVEKRQNNVTKATQKSVSAELDRIRSSVHDSQSRITDLPRIANATPGPDGDPGTRPILLPEDELICDINTALAAAWPVWYSEQIKIREEEEQSAIDPKSSSVPSP